MEYYVREYKSTDREQVRDICHLTATDPVYVADKDLVAALYAEYYTDYEPDGVFILARKSDDVAVGYILSASDTVKFVKTFKKEKLLKKVWKMNKTQAIAHWFAFEQDKMNSKKYPAHLHIDILPEAQRQGYGTQLMDKLLAHLKAKGVRGVCLGVGGTNEKGINFYKKYGFKLYKDFGKLGKIFGLDLTEYEVRQ